ncbi:biotin-independent malonate decarboxylase subunit beta [Methylobacterium nigriterrae]|uniref:biotin-independent malonate decarboxylase subunit beta n=1 Tax=Methylobacterium nigriterrae TaxID=3127512 RepID=UPI003013B28C
MRVARQSFYEATARKRVLGLLDKNSFIEFCIPEERITSPHLPSLGMPASFDDGVVVGEGTVDGKRVLIAAQEGGFMGGAVGEVHGAKITGLLERATDTKPEAVILLLDTGGVRLHEANAGLVAMGEIQRAALGARHAGVPVIVAIGGKNGCYGGMSIVARSCDWIVASEEGRLSISGPEVIETVEGIEEFDAQDRALVWRTMGAKHRRLIGEIDALISDDMAEFRKAILGFVGRSRPLDLDALEAEHAMLSRRLERFWDCTDGMDVWARLGVNDPADVPSLDTVRFNALLGALAEGAR